MEKEEDYYEEKKQNRHSLCSGAAPADTRHGSRGENKAKTGGKEKGEYRFRVSGTKKEVRDWKLSGKGADYFRITDYGLLQMDWEPVYIEPCVTATVTAVLEDGRTLTAAVRAYSETNIYIDKIFTDFEKQYITPSMTQKEKAEKAAWYISATSDYELYNSNWGDIFIKGTGEKTDGFFRFFTLLFRQCLLKLHILFLTDR